MNSEIYTSTENALIKSLLIRFRKIISDDEDLYGFSLAEFDEVQNAFPNVDIHDESASFIDNSWIVLNNMFAFLMNNNPRTILNKTEVETVIILWEKLKKA